MPTFSIARVSRGCATAAACLHTLPSGFNATREPLQIGAEIYGHAGLEADIEAIRLLASAMLALCEVPASRIDLGHVGVFRALARGRRGLAPEREEELFGALQGKDVPLVRELLAGIVEPVRSALLALAGTVWRSQGAGSGGTGLACNGRRSDRRCPICGAWRMRWRPAPELTTWPICAATTITAGLAFAAYCPAVRRRWHWVAATMNLAGPTAVGVPQPGFSMDLRELVRLSPDGGSRAR
jgi:hypothetical protein